jgi:hypothetical protein
MAEMEKWLDIVGYEGYYQVSNLGRVRSLDRAMYVDDIRYSKSRWVVRKGKILKNYGNGKKRHQVILRMFGGGKTYSVHRLVAMHFVPNPKHLPVVNHLNHNHHDNRASNLEWCTQKHNIEHAIKAGRMKHIYDQTHATITANQATTIKKLLEKGITRSEIARITGSSYDIVYHIAKGHTWRHI